MENLRQLSTEVSENLGIDLEWLGSERIIKFVKLPEDIISKFIDAIPIEQLIFYQRIPKKLFETVWCKINKVDLSLRHSFIANQDSRWLVGSGYEEKIPELKRSLSYWFDGKEGKDYSTGLPWSKLSLEAKVEYLHRHNSSILINEVNISIFARLWKLSTVASSEEVQRFINTVPPELINLSNESVYVKWPIPIMEKDCIFIRLELEIDKANLLSYVTPGSNYKILEITKNGKRFNHSF